MTTTIGAQLPMTWHDDLPGALPPGCQVTRAEELVLTPEPRNVGVARLWVAERLPASATADGRAAVALLTSELVTNGVVHARTQLRVRVAVAEGAVLVGVHDLDLGHREVAGGDREGGRGLSIVRAVAAASGQAQHAGGGKTSWFRVDL